MSIALNHPSHSIESSLLSYSGSNTNQNSPSFLHPPVQHATRETSRSLSPLPDIHAASRSGTSPTHYLPDHDLMDQDQPFTSPSAVTHDSQHTADHIPEIASEDGTHGQNHDRMIVEMADDDSISNEMAVPLASDSLMPNLETVPVAAYNVQATDRGDPVSVDLEESTTTSTLEDGRERDDGDDTEDESSSDEENRFWAVYQEDKSSPSEEELQEMKRREEVSALNHDHWESISYEVVDDPEYDVGEEGRISWTLQGFHGTKDNPNRQRVMRSPSINIGGFKWNIKLLPRGDETTDWVSVYIECSGPIMNHDGGSEVAPRPESVANLENDVMREKLEPLETSSISPIVPPSKEYAPWDVAAQIGCVMYNPAEPGVKVYEKSAHHFENDTRDWGWVRMHGPWNIIHQRQHLQKQALLQNDTLAFTAYIRTFRDPTKALWWHQPKGNAGWDNLVKTGHWGMKTRSQNGSALIATMSALIHLNALHRVVQVASTDHLSYSRRGRIRPLFDNLRKLLRTLQTGEFSIFRQGCGSSTITLEVLEKTFEWHDWDLESDPDVVEIWETIQHLLNEEYYKGSTEAPHLNLCREFAMFKYRQYSQSFNNSGFLPEDSKPKRREPRSTQEILDMWQGQISPHNKFWDSENGTSGLNLDPPTVLLLELHRQEYDTVVRKWKKLTHRVKLDENISCRFVAGQIGYTLSSIVVHCGGLRSGDFYTVTRPGGPSSQWIRYGGDEFDNNQITCLTTKQAIQAHEGSGESSEGHEPVAYLAIYVRCDALPKPSTLVQYSPSNMKNPPRVIDEHNLVNFSVAQEAKLIPVEIFDSSIFCDWTDRGIMDPWADYAVQIKNDRVWKLELPTSVTLGEVKEMLATEVDFISSSAQLHLYPLESYSEEERVVSNRLAPNLGPENFALAIGSLIDIDRVCRLWLYFEPVDPFPPPFPVDEPPPPPPSSEDITMGGTQEPGTFPIVDVPPELDIRILDVETLDKYAYIFVKKFDIRRQILIGIGSLRVDREQSIGESLKKHNLVSSDQKYDLYAEVNTICRKNPVPQNSSYTAEKLFHGAIVIIQERIPDKE